MGSLIEALARCIAGDNTDHRVARLLLVMLFVMLLLVALGITILWYMSQQVSRLG